MNTRARGQAAEKKACQHLEAQGLRLIEQNYSVRVGEIDLIMRDKEMLVFVEVRSRNTHDHGDAVETIDWRKKTRVVKAAQAYLINEGLYDRVDCRFDVVTFDGDRIEWYRDAFESHD